MSEARVRVSLVDGTMEIEGTEAFVSGQLEKFGDTIRVGFAQKAGVVEPPKEVEPPPQPTDDGGVSVVFRMANGVVHIVPDIPGNSRASRMANAARLLAYGAERLQNRSTVKFAD